jgi:hypothetical protein
MKKLLCLISLFFIFFHNTTIAQKVKYKAGTIVRTQVDNSNDSIVYYDSDIETRQKSYMDLLAGNWSVTTMHRQARMPADNLVDVSLTLKADSTFSSAIGCDATTGIMSVKGTSIKFKEIKPPPGNCKLNEQQEWILKLLSQTVSGYSVTASNLLLRDVSGNIVFEAVRNK